MIHLFGARVSGRLPGDPHLYHMTGRVSSEKAIKQIALKKNLNIIILLTKLNGEFFCLKNRAQKYFAAFRRFSFSPAFICQLEV